MSGNSRHTIAFNYIGAKLGLLDWLYPLFPPPGVVNHLVDAFGGSFCVSINAPRYRIITANDLNSEIVNFFRVLRDRGDELRDRLRLTPFSREEFELCYAPTRDEMEMARRFFTRTRQSFYGMGGNMVKTGWCSAVASATVMHGEALNRWLNGVEALDEVVDVLRRIQIEHMDALNLISKYGAREVFIYCDPPYHHATRSGRKTYAHEWDSDEDQSKLASALNATDAYAAVSGYYSPLMQDLYKGWMMHQAPDLNNRMGKRPKRECLWTNYDPAAFSKQISMEL